MKIQTSIKPNLATGVAGRPQPQVNGETENRGFAHMVADGFRAAGGATSFLLHTPTTLAGPIYSGKDGGGYIAGVATGTALILGAFTGTAAVLSGRNGLAAAAIGAGVGAFAGLFLGGRFELQATGNDDALLHQVARTRIQAEEAASGDKFHKAGVGLAQGYKKGFEVSYQRGVSAADKTLEVAAGTGSYLGGLFNPAG